MKYQAYAEYKDSGVEWFGSVPAPWISTRLKFESLINMGQSPNSDDCNQDGYGLPFLQGNAEFGDRSPSPKQYCDIPRKIATEGQLLFSVRAPVGALNIADQKYGIGRGLCAIASNERIASDFLWWLIPVVKSELNSVSTGSTFEAVSVEQVENVVFFRPSIFEQEKIANFLDYETAKIDTLIEKQQQLIKLLKEKRQAVISHAVTKGLNPNAPMRDSGVEWLVEVPEHWEIPKVGHCAFVTKLTGFEYTNLWRTSEDGEVIALRGFNIKDGKLDLYNAERISFDLSKKLARSKLSKGDIVFPCTGTIGNAALIESDDKFHINQNIAKISFEEKVSPKFAVYWLTSLFVRTLIGRNNMSGMQPVVLIGDIRKLPIPSMSLEEQGLITDYLDIQISKFNKIIGSGEQAIELMQERRTALISAAVTGKIDVRNFKATGV
jgi:type I restriction enzyme S subunit